MPVDLVFPLAALAAALLVARIAFARAAEPDPEDAARLFVEERIERHIERLANDYVETTAGDRAAGVPHGFARRIESFIGNVILWDALAAVRDDEISDAVRELVVIERESIYDRILERVHEHLATAAKAPRHDG